MELSQRNLIPMIEHYLDIQRFEQAKALVHEGLAENPESAELHYLAGRVQYYLDEYEQAEEHLQLAFKYGYSIVNVQYILGHIYAEKEQWVQAELAYLAALEEDPNNARLHASYGALLIRTGEREHGLRMLNEAEKLDPNDPVVLRHRLYYDIARNDNKHNMITLEKYMKLEDNQTAKLTQLGFSEYFKGNYRTAREHMRQAYLANPANRTSLSNVRFLEYEANPLLYPIKWSDRIGGLPFIWFWITMLVFLLYPYNEQFLSWGIISVILISIYIYLANSLVIIHQRVLDSGLPYWKAIGNRNVIKVVAVFALVPLGIMSLFFAGPLGLIAAYFIIKWLLKNMNDRA